MRVMSAVPVAIVICAAMPAFADAQSRVQAARNAERRGEWRKALEAWKAAYAADANAEYLIGIGDAYAHLGKKNEAKKNYDAYLADPLALPGNVEKVKAKIARLDPAPAELDSLPGTERAAGGGEVAPPSANAPPRAAPAQSEPELRLSDVDEPMALPGTQPAKPETPASPKEQPATAASTPTPVQPSSFTDAMPVALAVHRPERKAPEAALTSTRLPGAQSEASGASKTLAYVAAGVAVAGLGGGALFYTKAGSAHSDLTGKIHDGATAHSLLSDERSFRTFSLVGFAAGLVSVGVATALFAF